MPELHVQVDVLPPKSGVESEVDVLANRVRFRAFTLRRSWWRSRQRWSSWSGWFPIGDEAISLRWDAFDFDS